MKFLRSSRGRVVTGVVLVLALFLVRPGAQRLRTRIVRSISLALGRPVDVGSVTLRLLPQPGFDLENFVVHEDPEFGAEPVLAVLRCRRHRAREFPVTRTAGNRPPQSDRTQHQPGA